MPPSELRRLTFQLARGYSYRKSQSCEQQGQYQRDCGTKQNNFGADALTLHDDSVSSPTASDGCAVSPNSWLLKSLAIALTAAGHYEQSELLSATSFATPRRIEISASTSTTVPMQHDADFEIHTGLGRHFFCVHCSQARRFSCS